jgi:hypothetical protein
MIACSSADGSITSDDNDTGTVVDNDSEITDDSATTTDDSATPPGDTSTPGKDTGTPPTDTGTAMMDTAPPVIPGANYGAKCATMSADDLEAWEDIAVIRGKMKMGALNCIDAIQKASNAHANYMQLNGGLSHNETAGKPGFTGVNFWDRMKAAGFSGPGSAMFEVIHSIGDGHGSVLGEQGWVNTLYHRIPFVSFGAGGYGFGNNSGKWATVDFSSGGAAGAATAVATWPVNGDTGIWTTFRCASEIPNPLPGQTYAGYPVSLTGGKALALTSQQILKAGVDVPLVTLTKTSDSTGLIPDTQVYLIPKAPLTPSTKYDVKVKGTVGGSPFDLAFSFTTGAK